MNSFTTRNNVFTKICLLLLLPSLMHACGPGSQSTENENVAAASGDFFTPDPKVVDEKPITTLEIGDKAPDFRLPGVDGQYHELSDYEDKEVLVINFTCNHCPTAQAYEQRFIDLAEEYSEQGVQFIAISPNSPIAVLPEELGYTDLNDDFESMKIRADEMDYNFPYLYDGDEHLFPPHTGQQRLPIFSFLTTIGN